MPEISRWQAELALLDAESYPAVAGISSALATMSKAVGNFERLALDIPKMMEGERRALLADIDRQRRDSMRELERMRRAAFQDIRKEREAVLEAVLEAVRTEREAVMAGLHAEVSRTLEQAGKERVAWAGAFPEIATNVGGAALPYLKQTIDYLMKWVAILLACAAVVAGVFAWWLLRRRSRHSGQPHSL
jgi:hypothetical protein